MKITKVSDTDTYATESYNTTVDWLKDFANHLTKNADSIGYLRHFVVEKKYASIEEKMADLRSRVGFDLLKNIENDNLRIEKESSSSDKISSASHNDDNVKRMGIILNYIKDLVSSEPHLDAPAVILRCRQHDDLGFNDLRINFDKLNKYIEDLIAKSRVDDSNEVKYVPRDVQDNAESGSNETADYYAHASPQTS